jgi:hypothetical protein
LEVAQAFLVQPSKTFHYLKTTRPQPRLPQPRLPLEHLQTCCRQRPLPLQWEPLVDQFESSLVLTTFFQ